MSLPLFLVDALPTGGSYRLDGAEGHHAAAVQRLRAGESLLLGDGRGSTATAVVAAADKSGLTVTITSHGYVPPPVPRIVVAQGIPKADRGELAVQSMTEAGVDAIVPWSASRCVAVWRGERGAKGRDRWAATAREATKQARRAWLPEIPAAAGTAELTRRAAAATFVLHEEAQVPLSAVELPEAGEILLVVGPEGGIADEEVVAFTGAGAVLARLGPNVLRTSTAGLAAVCVLSARLGRW